MRRAMGGPGNLPLQAAFIRTRRNMLYLPILLMCERSHHFSGNGFPASTFDI
jgi:hypothetical protein